MAYILDSRFRDNLSSFVFRYRTSKWREFKYQSISAIQRLIHFRRSLFTCVTSRSTKYEVLNIVKALFIYSRDIMLYHKLLLSFLSHTHRFDLLLGLQVADDWPNKGEIVFENVSLRYDAERNPVVTDLSLKISPGQKVIYS